MCLELGTVVVGAKAAAGTEVYLHTHTHTQTHTHIHTYIHTYIHAYRPLRMLQP